jgi:hypothetical protein
MRGVGTGPHDVRASVTGLRAERGSVTAELAVALPAVVLVLAMVLSVGAASVARLRAVDAAAAGARVVALGEDDAAVRDAVRQVAGGSADATVRHDGEWVEVTVAAPVVGGWFGGGPLRASAQAVAHAEPGT